MLPKYQRLLIIFSFMSIMSLSTYLVLSALKDNIVFFFSPTEVYEKQKYQNKKIRVGGLVVENSINKEKNNIWFEITDKNKTMKIFYNGILPDLFREGQGVVIEGYYYENKFEATEVLAKHDENYMPREVSDILKKQGKWKGQ